MKNQQLIIVGVFSALLLVFVSAAWAVRGYRAMEAKKRRAQTLSECRANLKAIFTGEKAYFGEYDRYEEDFWKIGFAPERGNHAVYVLSRTGPLEDRSTATLPVRSSTGIIGADEFRFPSPTTAELLAKIPSTAELGMRGTCPACEVTAVCVTQYARWSISTAPRTLSDGGVVLAGEPSLDQSSL